MREAAAASIFPAKPKIIGPANFRAAPAWYVEHDQFAIPRRCFYRLPFAHFRHPAQAAFAASAESNRPMNSLPW
jgi:hypothetical protein